MPKSYIRGTVSVILRYLIERVSFQYHFCLKCLVFVMVMDHRGQRNKGNTEILYKSTCTYFDLFEVRKSQGEGEKERFFQGCHNVRMMT